MRGSWVLEVQPAVHSAFYYNTKIIMEYYVVTYTGPFGFIKPWTAVRDASGGETYSQQFLTPSIIEGIRQKLEVSLIVRHKLTYAGIDIQQEVVLAKAWTKKSKLYFRERSILKRGVMLRPSLQLAFTTRQEAEKASCQHICLCRNEDILLPDSTILKLTQEEFNRLDGYELRFGKSDQSFIVGYNRFCGNEEMHGYIEISGNPLQGAAYE